MQPPAHLSGPAGSPATTASPTTSAIADQAHDSMGEVVSQAHEAVGQVTEQAKQQATSQLASGKDRAVDGLVTVAQALRQTGQHLHQQEQRAVGGYVEQVAERVEEVTNYLRARDVPELVGETQEFARRQPGLFFGAALALGFVGARFLMSSGRRATTERATSANPSSGASQAVPTVYERASFAAPEMAHDSFDRVSRSDPNNAEQPTRTPGF